MAPLWAGGRRRRETWLVLGVGGNVRPWWMLLVSRSGVKDGTEMGLLRAEIVLKGKGRRRVCVVW